MNDPAKRGENNSSVLLPNPFDDKDEESKSFISASEDIWNMIQKYKDKLNFIHLFIFDLQHWNNKNEK